MAPLPTNVSAPRPPTRTSAASPPVIVSAPDPPVKVKTPPARVLPVAVIATVEFAALRLTAPVAAYAFTDAIDVALRALVIVKSPAWAIVMAVSSVTFRVETTTLPVPV